MPVPGAGKLARFQDAFSRALLDPHAVPAPEVAALCAQPGFAVYRNTVIAGCIDALQANFPAVARLVGDEWFRAAAGVFVRRHPPEMAALVHYGAAFPAFLAAFEPAAGLPWLPDVARLDRFWTEAHTASAQEALKPESLARLAPAALAGTVLRPHPAARWAWFADAPCCTIWSRNRDDRDHGEDLDWAAEGALVTRPGNIVIWREVGAGHCAFLAACAAGKPVSCATQAALEADPETDLTTLMATLLEAGAFRGAGPLSLDRALGLK